MKKLLTVLYPFSTNDAEEYKREDVEILYTDEDRSTDEIIKNGLKQASGKYTFFAESKLTYADLNGFLYELDKSSSDIIIFNGGFAVRTPLLKGKQIKEGADGFSFCFSAVLDCKTIKSSEVHPFEFKRGKGEYSDDRYANMLNAVAEFERVKPKLNKDIYNFTYEILSRELVDFYTVALLAVYEKMLSTEKIGAFDDEVKKDVTLYTPLEKRITFANLKKLRKKGFKIDLITAFKLKRAVKK